MDTFGVKKPSVSYQRFILLLLYEISVSPVSVYPWYCYHIMTMYTTRIWCIEHQRFPKSSLTTRWGTTIWLLQVWGMWLMLFLHKFLLPDFREHWLDLKDTYLICPCSFQQDILVKVWETNTVFSYTNNNLILFGVRKNVLAPRKIYSPR